MRRLLPPVVAPRRRGATTVSALGPLRGPEGETYQRLAGADVLAKALRQKFLRRLRTRDQRRLKFSDAFNLLHRGLAEISEALFTANRASEIFPAPVCTYSTASEIQKTPRRGRSPGQKKFRRGRARASRLLKNFRSHGTRADTSLSGKRHTTDTLAGHFAAKGPMSTRQIRFDDPRSRCSKSAGWSFPVRTPRITGSTAFFGGFA